jgi:hypothetical protein
LGCRSRGCPPNQPSPLRWAFFLRVSVLCCVVVPPAEPRVVVASVLAVAADAVLVPHNLLKLGAHLVTALARLHMKKLARRSGLEAGSTRKKREGRSGETRVKPEGENEVVSPTHTRIEERASVWCSEFTTKAATPQGGDIQNRWCARASRPPIWNSRARSKIHIGRGTATTHTRFKKIDSAAAKLWLTTRTRRRYIAAGTTLSLTPCGMVAPKF